MQMGCLRNRGMKGPCSPAERSAAQQSRPPARPFCRCSSRLLASWEGESSSGEGLGDSSGRCPKDTGLTAWELNDEVFHPLYTIIYWPTPSKRAFYGVYSVWPIALCELLTFSCLNTMLGTCRWIWITGYSIYLRTLSTEATDIPTVLWGWGRAEGVSFTPCSGRPNCEDARKPFGKFVLFILLFMFIKL